MAKFVRLSHEHCTLVTDKSHFSIDEYDAITFGGGSVAEFDNALYVIVHGFIPSEIGIATTTPNAAQRAGYAPNITFTDSGGSAVSGITEYPIAMHLEVEGESLDVRQRMAMGYSVITFGGGSVAEFDNALYVIVHGFIPSEIGIATTTPNAAQRAGYAPNITFTDSGGSAVSGITEYPIAMHLEVEGESLDVRQRITFEYGIRFTGSALFPPDTDGAPDTRTVRLTSSKRTSSPRVSATASSTFPRTSSVVSS